jgi:hypothetical protein
VLAIVPTKWNVKSFRQDLKESCFAEDVDEKFLHQRKPQHGEKSIAPVIES